MHEKKFAVLTVLAAVVTSGAMYGQDQIDFISAIDSPAADEVLRSKLQTSTGIAFDRIQQADYLGVIRKLVETGSAGRYVARVTPYAYVAAELLGAEFDTLATYVRKDSSNTLRTTYHSYFVVRREDVRPPEGAQAPGLVELKAYLRRQRRKFIYRDKFSTSGYFLPSLYLHGEQVFSVQGPAPAGLIPIATEQTPPGESATDLVQRIADHINGADLAAVWDGTIASLDQATKDRLYFIELDSTLLPNDLLVCSRSLGADLKRRIQAAIRDLGKVGQDDVQFWQDIENAPDARLALNTLQHLATAPPAPVSVRIRTSQPSPWMDRCLRAARQAVRLSGTEFVVLDEGLSGQKPDVDWILAPLHDGAISLTAQYASKSGRNETPIPTQSFPISFTNTEEDLAKRIEILIRTEMHRIRYVWPYEVALPTVLRDVDFPLPVGAVLGVMKIQWQDPKANTFAEISGLSLVKVDNADLYKFRLSGESFPKTREGTYDFDPMSNLSYRVFLVRPPAASPMIEAMTYGFLVIMAGALAGFIWDLRRTNPCASQAPTAPGTSWDEALVDIQNGLLAPFFQPWLKGRIVEADVLWCHRNRLEQFIEELKTEGFSATFLQIRTWKKSWWTKIGLEKIVGAGADMTHESVFNVDPSRVGDPARVSSLVPFLIAHRRVSSFAGKPLEWEALNQAARQRLQPLATSALITSRGGLLSPDDPLIQSLVSSHFKRVLDDCFQKASFFGAMWQIQRSNGERRLVRVEEFAARINAGEGMDPVDGLMLDIAIDSGTYDRLSTQDPALEGFILAKLVDASYGDVGNKIYLRLQFEPLAVLGSRCSGLKFN